jgi:hypothetical protein
MIITNLSFGLGVVLGTMFGFLVALSLVTVLLVWADKK